MSEPELAEFTRELKKFDTAMLVTRAGDTDLRSRPMVIAGCDESCRIWFTTSVDSGKLEELTEFPFVNVAMQDGKRFLSVSGTVRVTRDPDLLKRVWDESQRVWFEKGRDDPELVVLEVVPTFAEYWDRAGAEAIRFALAEASAIIQGKTLTGDEAAHAKLDFRARETAEKGDEGD